jgi:hypothetical protein
MDREKKIDSVKMMREIRDRLGKVFGQMTFEEQKKYMAKELSRKSRGLTGRLQPTAERRGG